MSKREVGWKIHKDYLKVIAAFAFYLDCDLPADHRGVPPSTTLEVTLQTACAVYQTHYCVDHITQPGEKL